MVGIVCLQRSLSHTQYESPTLLHPANPFAGKPLVEAFRKIRCSGEELSGLLAKQKTKRSRITGGCERPHIVKLNSGFSPVASGRRSRYERRRDECLIARR